MFEFLHTTFWSQFGQAFWSDVGQAFGYFIAASLGVLSINFKDWWKKRNKKGIADTVNYNLAIRDILVELRVKFNSDRVKLFQFKNGEYYITGESEQKFCLTHVILAPGVSYPEAFYGNNQQIPISYVTRLLKETIEHKKCFKNVSEIENDNYIKLLLQTDSVHNVLFLPVFSKFNKIIGIVVITWLNETADPDIDCDYIKEIIARLGYTLKP